MKEHLFKNAAFSFLIINVWTTFLFFNYLLEKPGLFYGFGTLCLYLYSMFFGILVGTVLLLLRITIFRKVKSGKLKGNFFYLFAGIFNLNLFITWLILVLLKIIEVDQGEILEVIICNCIISLLILTDIFIFKRILKLEKNMEAEQVV
jgi:uncharacterized membrane protein